MLTRLSRARHGSFGYWIARSGGPGGAVCVGIASGRNPGRGSPVFLHGQSWLPPWPSCTHGALGAGPGTEGSLLSCRCLTQPPVPSAVPLSCSVSSTPLEKWPSAWTRTVDSGSSCGASAGECVPELTTTTSTFETVSEWMAASVGDRPLPRGGLRLTVGRAAVPSPLGPALGRSRHVAVASTLHSVG